jgi:hypothetical protein|tara:strand:+ start:230 stop:652 length:423 start_codon:yes stop_codon:yes gene_type:complete
MDTVESVAAEALKHLETKVREHDGTSYVSFKDSRPQWLFDAIYSAHGDMLPDDFVFRFCQDGLQYIAEGNHEETPESDIYTTDLTLWLASHNERVFYLSEALTEFGDMKDGFQALQYAQYIERRECMDSMRGAVEAQIEE